MSGGVLVKTLLNMRKWFHYAHLRLAEIASMGAFKVIETKLLNLRGERVLVEWIKSEVDLKSSKRQLTHNLTEWNKNLHVKLRMNVFGIYSSAAFELWPPQPSSGRENEREIEYECACRQKRQRGEFNVHFFSCHSYYIPCSSPTATCSPSSTIKRNIFIRSFVLYAWTPLFRDNLLDSHRLNERQYVLSITIDLTLALLFITMICTTAKRISPRPHAKSRTKAIDEWQ